MSSTSPLRQISCSRSFKGYQQVFEHNSVILQCAMKFGVYLPDNVNGPKLPVLFWLSGLTCTEENFIVKSGMQRFASAHRVIVVNPDTSPRGEGVVKGTDEDPNFGAAAGFYLDATEPIWAKNYRMYSYIMEEFAPLVFAQFPIDQSRCGLFGHSMGGHGTLTIGLKNPDLFKSLSVFAPICNPCNASNFGKKYFNAYLGAGNTQKWAEYDSTELAKQYSGPKREVLIDQGAADPFLATGELLIENLLAVQNPNLKWNYRLQPDYDHGYYFISTFIEDHFLFHLRCWAPN